MILEYIKTLPCNKGLMLEMLTKKLLTLSCLLSGQRGQTLGVLDLLHHSYANGAHSFYIASILKTTRPGKHQEPLRFVEYTIDKDVCVVDCLDEYITRTSNIRENLEGKPQQLILSYWYPHNPVGIQTIARYVKDFLGMAGIDLTVFTAHSTRKASTSKANNIGLTMSSIQKAAGWSSDSTFRKYYKLPIYENFGKGLLEGSMKH